MLERQDTVPASLFVLLAIPFVIIGPAEVLAQGTNASNVTNAE